MSAWWTTLPGVVVIALTLREIFQDLFHPTASGSLSGFIARSMFGAARRVRWLLSAVGPLSLVIVILCWTLLLACGFGLVYWGGFPGDFRFQIPEDQQRGGFGTMLYFSLEALTTLGLGDITPRADWARMAAVLEALIGFALVTASVSFILLIYPALSRMRTLARRTSILVRAGEITGIDVISEGIDRLLAELALDLIRTRVDFIHFPIIYYFHSNAKEASLPQALQLLGKFARTGSQVEDNERVRLASAALSTALAELAKVLAEDFIHTDASDTDAVLAAYAEDHMLPKAG